MGKANAFNLIRLLAAVQVILVHTFNHNGIEGALVSAIKIFPGVPIFFFVSGLMIYGAYDRSRNDGLLTFYINRFLRIYPGLWLCIALSTISLFCIGYLNLQDLNLRSFSIWLLGQASFVQFYNPEFMRGYGIGVLNGALWTIAVELQFYVLAPLVYYFMTRAKFLAIILFALSVLLNFMAHNIFSIDSMVNKLLRVSFLPWVFIFIFGFFIAHSERVRSWISSVKVGYLLIAYFATMFLLGGVEVNSSNSINALSAIVLSLLVFKVGCSQSLSMSRLALFCNKTDISYGLYLYHMPLINFLMYVGGLSSLEGVLWTVFLSFSLAIFSWYTVEKPALELKRTFRLLVRNHNNV